ncbi:Lpg1974 family pore-forming outer membrane protein [Simkania sp.]|uniref:Lpg1974 family pore-forming outer membrane protein n=1 Tax=Simkania sp. TaxID=34094 RepID=UPI003B52F331
MFKKTLFAFTLLCSLSYAADKQPMFKQGDAPLSDQEHTPSFNHPAGVNLNQSIQGYITASYLYWYAAQDGLDLATTAAFNNGAIAPATSEMKTIMQDFDYACGFKVGLGMGFDFDQWELGVDYTYYRLNETTSKSAPTLTPGTGVIFSNNWYLQSSAANQGIAGDKLSSRWRLRIDWIDATLNRAYYQGECLTLRPYVGLRTSFIRQTLNVSMSDLANVNPVSEPVKSRNSSNSWAVGPRGGIQSAWLLGYGFSFIGDVGASLLYTQYSSVKHSESAVTQGSTGAKYSSRDVNTLRPMLEASLGFRWGHYFGCNAYHLSLAATYDFNYLWSQNMIRQLNDMFITGTSAGPGDLFLHGLTITARFDF